MGEGAAARGARAKPGGFAGLASVPPGSTRDGAAEPSRRAPLQRSWMSLGSRSLRIFSSTSCGRARGWGGGVVRNVEPWRRRPLRRANSNKSGAMPRRVGLAWVASARPHAPARPVRAEVLRHLVEAQEDLSADGGERRGWPVRERWHASFVFLPSLSDRRKSARVAVRSPAARASKRETVEGRRAGARAHGRTSDMGRPLAMETAMRDPAEAPASGVVSARAGRGGARHEFWGGRCVATQVVTVARSQHGSLEGRPPQQGSPERACHEPVLLESLVAAHVVREEQPAGAEPEAQVLLLPARSLPRWCLVKQADRRRGRGGRHAQSQPGRRIERQAVHPRECSGRAGGGLDNRIGRD